MNAPVFVAACTDGQMVVMTPAPFVTIPLAAMLTGLTEKAIRRKIEEGKWVEGREYERSPDGGLYVSLEGYGKWVRR